MRRFIRAVELGNLSAVAREQRTTQPTISKAITALERALGTRLLERTTTSLRATDQGRRFYEHACRMLETYAEAVVDVQDRMLQPVGFLRVAAPLALGQLRVNRMVLDFQALHPAIEVELLLGDRAVDLIEEAVDVAVRIGGPLPGQGIAKRVAVSRRFFVAAPGYLQTRPRVRTLRDLAKHEYIRFASDASGNTLQVTDGKHRQAISTDGRFRVNSALAIRESLVLGRGLGVVPAWLVDDLLRSGELVRILPRWSAEPHEVHLLFPSRRHLPARTRMIVDHLAAALATAPGCGPV